MIAPPRSGEGRPSLIALATRQRYSTSRILRAARRIRTFVEQRHRDTEVSQRRPKTGKILLTFWFFSVQPLCLCASVVDLGRNRTTTDIREALLLVSQEH